jgi:hypothetical protein
MRIPWMLRTGDGKPVPCRDCDRGAVIVWFDVPLCRWHFSLEDTHNAASARRRLRKARAEQLEREAS